MTEAKIINNNPVSDDELITIARLDKEYRVPHNCAECQVLTTRKSAAAIGMVVLGGRDDASEERFSPPNRESEIIHEIDERVEAAVNGSCKFIARQECWRLEVQ